MRGKRDLRGRRRKNRRRGGKEEDKTIFHGGMKEEEEKLPWREPIHGRLDGRVEGIFQV